MNELAVIKIGGTALEDVAIRREFAVELHEVRRDWQVVVVHGGAAELSRVSRSLGHEPRIENGIRLTTAEEMMVADMVLAGSANKRLVRALAAAGVPAVGICGSDGRTFTGSAEELPAGTRTGRIESADPRLLRALLAEDFVPVVSSVSDDGVGGGLNVNADPAAVAVAVAVAARTLVFVSDTDGVRKRGAVIQVLHAASVEAEIAIGTITDGMIPKIRSSVAAVHDGVGSVQIGSYERTGSLHALLTGGTGTTIR